MAFSRDQLDNFLIVYFLLALTALAFWCALGASSITFMAYEEWVFNQQPPAFAGQLVPPAPKGQSF